MVTHSQLGQRSERVSLQLHPQSHRELMIRTPSQSLALNLTTLSASKYYLI